MSQLATNCANYKVKPILNTSAGSGTFGANRYLIPFKLSTFNNSGTSTQEAINGSSGPGNTQDSLFGGVSDFSLQAISTPGDWTYNYTGNNSLASWISSLTIQWIANDVANGEEDWRIVINAQNNSQNSSTRAVTILFRFGNGNEYGTIFPLYVSQNTNANNPSADNSCNPNW